MPNDPSQARRELDAMETQLGELHRQMESKQDPEAQKRVAALSGLVGDLRADLDSRAQTAWQRVKLARHPQRPYFLDYAGYLFEEFSEEIGRASCRERV